MTPHFPGWSNTNDVFRRSIGRVRAVVSRPDGWSWGYLILDDDGEVLAGRVTSSMDVFQAVDQANLALENQAAAAAGP